MPIALQRSPKMARNVQWMWLQKLWVTKLFEYKDPYDWYIAPDADYNHLICLRKLPPVRSAGKLSFAKDPEGFPSIYQDAVQPFVSDLLTEIWNEVKGKSFEIVQRHRAFGWKKGNCFTCICQVMGWMWKLSGSKTRSKIRFYRLEMKGNQHPAICLKSSFEVENSINVPRASRKLEETGLTGECPPKSWNDCRANQKTVLAIQVWRWRALGSFTRELSVAAHENEITKTRCA